MSKRPQCRNVRIAITPRLSRRTSPWDRPHPSFPISGGIARSRRQSIVWTMDSTHLPMARGIVFRAVGWTGPVGAHRDGASRWRSTARSASLTWKIRRHATASGAGATISSSSGSGAGSSTSRSAAMHTTPCQPRRQVSDRTSPSSTADRRSRAPSTAPPKTPISSRRRSAWRPDPQRALHFTRPVWPRKGGATTARSASASSTSNTCD